MPDRTTDPVVQAVRYTVNAVPEDSSPDAHVFEITVERRRGGLWTAIRHHRYLGRDGTWTHGPDWPVGNPGSREPVTDAECVGYHSAQEEWLADTRYDLETALKLAREAAPHVTVNGLTPAAALARIARLGEVTA